MVITGLVHAVLLYLWRSKKGDKYPKLERTGCMIELIGVVILLLYVIYAAVAGIVTFKH